MRTDELYAQKKEEPSTVNKLLSRIQDLEDKVNALNEEKEFYDPETASTSGMSHVPSEPSRIPSPRGMLRRDSGLRHFSRNSTGTSGNVLEETTCSRKNVSVLDSNCHEAWRRIETITAEFNHTDSTIFQES